MCSLQYQELNDEFWVSCQDNEQLAAQIFPGGNCPQTPLARWWVAPPLFKHFCIYPYTLISLNNHFLDSLGRFVPKYMCNFICHNRYVQATKAKSRELKNWLAQQLIILIIPILCEPISMKTILSRNYPLVCMYSVGILQSVDVSVCVCDYASVHMYKQGMLQSFPCLSLIHSLIHLIHQLLCINQTTQIKLSGTKGLYQCIPTMC